MPSDKLYIHKLHALFYLTPLKFYEFYAKASDPSQFDHVFKEFLLTVSPNQVDYYRQVLKHFSYEKQEDFCGKNNITPLTFLDEAYPKKLKEINSAPPVLFAKGNLALLKTNQLAIVGPRKPSDYGQEVAKKLSQDLAPFFTLTSGMAAGIDTIVHQTALEAHTATIAVLGTGIDIIYPKANTSLYHKIAEKGLLLSEFPPHVQGQPYHFPQRNRIVSGLSSGVLVCEGNHKSGSLITARFATEQNRDVFAVPGSIFSEHSSGVHRLISDGAKLVNSAKDILNDYQIQQLPFKKSHSIPKQKETTPLPVPENMSDKETQLFNLIQKDPISIETLTEKSDTSFSEILHMLSFLEIKGFIKSLPGQQYIRA